MFVPPHGKLYLKMQLVLAKPLLSSASIELPKWRSGPKELKIGIPSSESPNVLRRVLETKEP
jgi:hypothetical protein